MSAGELGRIKGDLTIIQRAMGLRLSFGKEMLLFDLALTAAAAGSSVVGLFVENVWFEVVPFAAFTALCLAGLYVASRRNADLSHEVKLQVGFAVTTYFAVSGAACGYALAAFFGESIGVTRTALLHAASLVYILGFSFVLILNALKFRDRHYCLGLAASLLLTGLVVPVFDPHYIFPLANGCLAIGYSASLAIQWMQLREAGTLHAAD